MVLGMGRGTVKQARSMSVPKEKKRAFGKASPQGFGVILLIGRTNGSARKFRYHCNVVALVDLLTA